MKILNKEEAIELIKANPEGTMKVVVVEHIYHCGPHVCGGTLKLAESIEVRDESEEYPEGMCLNMYGDGRGWEVPIETFLHRNGTTLNDKLSDEQGYHCGDMYLYTKNILNLYTEGPNVYISGTDEEIQQLLPYLAIGMYVLIFED